MTKIRAIGKISLPKARPNQKLKKQKEIPFAPVPSGTINFGPETFAHSDAFSKMMDRAHEYAMRANHKYGK